MRSSRTEGIFLFNRVELQKSHESPEKTPKKRRRHYVGEVAKPLPPHSATLLCNEGFLQWILPCNGSYSCGFGCVVFQGQEMLKQQL